MMKTNSLLTFIVLVTISCSCKKRSVKPAEPNYTNFKILSLKLNTMPFLDNTSDWDPFDGPDVFFNMEDASGTTLYNGASARFKDIDKNDLPLVWDFIKAYQITNLDVTHFVTVYDYDTIDPNDLIGYIGFKMNDHKVGYPKTVTKTSGALTITITGEWY